MCKVLMGISLRKGLHPDLLSALSWGSEGQWTNGKGYKKTAKQTTKQSASPPRPPALWRMKPPRRMHQDADLPRDAAPWVSWSGRAPSSCCRSFCHQKPLCKTFPQTVALGPSYYLVPVTSVTISLLLLAPFPASPGLGPGFCLRLSSSFSVLSLGELSYFCNFSFPFYGNCL